MVEQTAWGKAIPQRGTNVDWAIKSWCGERSNKEGTSRRSRSEVTERLRSQSYTLHPPSYAEAKKMKSLTFHTHGCPRASSRDCSSSTSWNASHFEGPYYRILLHCSKMLSLRMRAIYWRHLHALAFCWSSFLIQGPLRYIGASVLSRLRASALQRAVLCTFTDKLATHVKIEAIVDKFLVTYLAVGGETAVQYGLIQTLLSS